MFPLADFRMFRIMKQNEYVAIEINSTRAMRQNILGKIIK